MAGIYLPPIARKKKVLGWPRQDSTRVFSDYVENSKQETTSYGSHFIRHNVPPTPQRALSPSRKNKPQPVAVTFLRQNPRFVCEPICHVDTTVSKPEAFHSWWPNEILERPIIKPQYTLHSTSRADYRTLPHDSQMVGSYSKYASLQQVLKPDYNIGKFSGGTPSQAMPNVAEKISYEHQFNSRIDPSHPIRGRRHGCFVWKTAAPVFKTYHGKCSKFKSFREKKDEFIDPKLVETMYNSDAKSVISTIADGSKEMEHLNGYDRKNSKTFERKGKDNAWTSANGQNDHQTRPAEEEYKFDMNDEEIEDVIKPSRPRRQSTPPHVI